MTPANMECNQPEPIGQAVCAMNGSKLFEGAQKIVNEFQMSDTDLTLLDFGFSLFRL